MRIAVTNNGNSKVLQYFSQAGNFVQVADLTLRFSASDPAVYHYVKMVIDNKLQQYKRFLVDGSTYDLSGIPIPTGGGLVEDRNVAGIKVTTLQAVVATAVVDNFILTIDEP